MEGPPESVTSRLRRLADPAVLSGATALVVTVAALVTYLIRDSAPAGYRADDTFSLILTLAATLPLAALWVSPLAVLCVSSVAVVGLAVGDYEPMNATLWAVIVAAVTTAAFDTVRRAVVGGFVLGGGLVAVFVLYYGQLTWGQYLAIWLVFSVAWAVSWAVRVYRMTAARAERRAALFAADRDARAREAVAEERARLARELHDSVGHALNVVVLHAGAARRVLEKKPELAGEALTSIETAGRQALADIERMLGILRAEEDVSMESAPGVDQIPGLVQQVREAGLPVELALEPGPGDLPSSVDLTIYRIVQEALTNVLKHAGHARAWVEVACRDGMLYVTVADDGRGAAAAPSDTGGRGLAGMRERVLIFGGELLAGPRPEGGYLVQARLPLKER
ncbi:MAG: sensor histidine kinase [Thermoleophilia bacterium]|nr:sensor histidine kinase [Thermoleophilia bacterium]